MTRRTHPSPRADDHADNRASYTVEAVGAGPSAAFSDPAESALPDPQQNDDAPKIDVDGEARRQLNAVYPHLLATARTRTRNPHDAADLVHDTITAVWARRAQLDLTDDGFARYLMTVLRNNSAHPGTHPDAVPLRLADLGECHPDPTPGPETTVVSTERAVALHAALREADPLGATVLLETVGHGRPISTVAAELNLTASQAGMRRLRTQRALATQLRQAGVAGIAALTSLGGLAGRMRAKKTALVAVAASSIGASVLTAAVWQTPLPAPIAINRQPPAITVAPTAPAGVRATVRVLAPVRTPAPAITPAAAPVSKPAAQPVTFNSPAPAPRTASPTPAPQPSPTAAQSPAATSPQAICYSSSQSAVIWRDTDNSSFGTNTIPADQPSYTWHVTTNTGTWTLTQTAAQLNALPRC